GRDVADVDVADATADEVVALEGRLAVPPARGDVPGHAQRRVVDELEDAPRLPAAPGQRRVLVLEGEEAARHGGALDRLAQPLDARADARLEVGRVPRRTADREHANHRRIEALGQPEG